MSTRIAGLLVAASCLLGCGDDSADGSGGGAASGSTAAPSSSATSGGPTVSEACLAYGTALCAAGARCTPLTYPAPAPSAVWASEAECASRVALQCEGIAALDGSGYTPTGVEACAEGLATIDCAVLLHPDESSTGVPQIEACKAIYAGTRAAGEPCASGAQCAAGACLFDTSCGTCTELVGVGEACGLPKWCGLGVECDRATFTCTAPFPGAGEACGVTCVPGLACVGTCVPYAEVGAACDPGGSVCDLSRGQFCDETTRTCTARRFEGPVAEGEPCGLSDTGDVEVRCAGGLFCDDVGDRLCHPLVPDGGACSRPSSCQYPAYCDGGVCVLGAECG